MNALWLAAALAGIQIDAPGGPRVDQAATITVTDGADHPLPGQTVRVVHRPGLALEQEQAIGITDARGQVAWSPSAPGLARVRAGDTWQSVHVAGPVPATTVAALVALVLAAAASIGWGLRSGAWRSS